MGARRAAGRADISDDIAALYRRAGLHAEPAQVAVPRREAEVVTHDNEVAVIAGVLRGFDRSVCRGVYLAALLGRNIEALMKRGFARKRIGSAAKGPRKPSERRPDRRRGRGQRFLALDVAPDVAEPVFEA